MWPPCLRATQQDTCRAGLTLAQHLLSSTSPHVVHKLHSDGGGAALALTLLNAAGGAMPTYVHDEVGATMRVLYTAQSSAAAGWVQAATNDPFFSHARVTGPDATLPTGGNRTNMVANYAMVLGYLAGHGAWDHFTTVLTRGVMVSEAEDQDA